MEATRKKTNIIKKEEKWKEIILLNFYIYTDSKIKAKWSDIVIKDKLQQTVLHCTYVNNSWSVMYSLKYLKNLKYKDHEIEIQNMCWAWKQLVSLS